MDIAGLPTLRDTLRDIEATIAGIRDPQHRAWLEMYRTHWWSESIGDLAVTRATLAERVVFRRYGTPIVAVGLELETREQVMARYQAALDAGLKPGGPIEEARWAFGDWGISVEGIFTGFAWGRNLHRYDPGLEPEIAYMHRYRMSAIFPVEASTGLLAGEILYAGEVLALQPSTEAERARIYRAD